jgi:hypothetical protein
MAWQAGPRFGARELPVSPALCKAAAPLAAVRVETSKQILRRRGKRRRRRGRKRRKAAVMNWGPVMMMRRNQMPARRKRWKR